MRTQVPDCTNPALFLQVKMTKISRDIISLTSQIANSSNYTRYVKEQDLVCRLAQYSDHRQQ